MTETVTTDRVAAHVLPAGKVRPELPRERLLEYGANALTEGELLAVLLQNGAPNASAVETANEILDRVGGIAHLGSVPPCLLTQLGVGPAKLARILAALEITRRILAANIAGQRIESREQVVHYILSRYFRRDQEVGGAIYLNARCCHIGDSELFRGSLRRLVVDPRPILVEALGKAAFGVILFHTHPSGDATPSQEDLLWTRRIAEAGEIVGVDLIDHLIVGRGGEWISLKERGGW